MFVCNLIAADIERTGVRSRCSVLHCRWFSSYPVRRWMVRERTCSRVERCCGRAWSWRQFLAVSSFMASKIHCCSRHAISRWFIAIRGCCCNKRKRVFLLFFLWGEVTKYLLVLLQSRLSLLTMVRTEHLVVSLMSLSLLTMVRNCIDSSLSL